MSQKNVTKYNIKKNGIDICKIIFTKAKDIPGRFDIKIGFYDKKYKIKIHKLFSYKSDGLFIEKLENKQISYHYGREDKVKIQLRNIKDKESPQEILYNLVPPNDYSLFPIPLFKIEINNENDEPLILQNSNKTHHSGIDIELENNNTVEIYMANPNDNKNRLSKSFELARMFETLIPIEYLASNGGYVGYEKHKYFFDKTGVHTVKKELMAKDFNLVFDGYYNSTFDNKKITTTITFIENELYEDIIMNSSFNPIVKFENKKERIQGYLNGGNECYTFDKQMLIKDTIGERIYRKLKGKEKQEFFDIALSSRKKLGKRLFEYNNKKQGEKKYLEDKVNEFLYAIIKLNEYYSIKYMNGEIKDDAPFEIIWMIDNPRLKSEEISILLGKYLGIDNYKIIRIRITSDNEEKIPKNNGGDETIVYQINDISKISFDYCYFEYDSIYNIHPLSYCINTILESNEIPLVCISEDIYRENIKWNNLFVKMKRKEYTLSPLEYRIINIEEEFNKNKDLSKIYDIIIKQKNYNN